MPARIASTESHENVRPHLHLYSVLSGDADPLVDLGIIEEWGDRQAWGTIDLRDKEAGRVVSLPSDLHSHEDEDVND